MIWQPKPGDRVILKYRKEMRQVCPHYQVGTVEIAGRGPGPICALVKLDSDDKKIVVPRGNLSYYLSQEAAVYLQKSLFDM